MIKNWELILMVLVGIIVFFFKKEQILNFKSDENTFSFAFGIYVLTVIFYILRKFYQK